MPDKKKKVMQDQTPPIMEEVILTVKSGETIRAIRTSDSDGQQTASDLNADGSVSDSVQGRSRQGESGNIKVCRTLIARLNHDGAIVIERR
jgi:hypothetical protein